MGIDEEHRVRTERARAVALFRYRLVREAADPGLSTRQRGRLVRDLAARDHPGPFGIPVRVSRQSLDRWITAWRRGGFDALVPAERQVSVRTPQEVLDLAEGLKRENPDRTAAQVVRILRANLGWTPSESTVLRLFRRLELGGRAAHPPAVFGRFEAANPNERWTGDALHGPVIAGRKTYLFAFLDDHSRLVTGHRFGYAEDTVRLASALRPALASRGVPQSVHVDNGSSFVDSWLLRACAVLGMRLIHSTPGRPQGRGKIERFFETVRGQFLVEVTGTGEPGHHQIDTLADLNSLFTAWVETVYHRRTHSETGQTPLQRWSAGQPFALPDAPTLREAFLWSEHRTVRKTATVSLHANTYEVDPTLVGRKVELVFDPFDLTHIEVRHQGNPMGLAIACHIGRHSHPKARPEQPPTPPADSGITYPPLIQATHTAELAHHVNFDALRNQPSPPTTQEPQP